MTTKVEASASELAPASLCDVGEVHWVLITSDPKGLPRPGVVICDHGDRVEMVYGGSNPDPKWRHLTIEAESIAGKAMGLRNDTHFRHYNVAYVTKTELRGRMGKVPYDLVTDFESIAFEFWASRT